MDDESLNCHTPRELIAQLHRQGITDERVLAAIAAVPRDRFVPPDFQDRAWANLALPIGLGQTISQPYVVALMTQALRLTGRERVLEIGTGSGYQAAILGRLAAEVWSVERHPELTDQATALLAELGYHNVRVRLADGTLGWPEPFLFDRIIVTAGSPSVPPPLLDQLSPDGGRLVIPLGTLEDQRLIAVQLRSGVVTEEDLGPVRFVPLLGESGWPVTIEPPIVHPAE